MERYKFNSRIGISKQQISDIWKNKDKILKFTDRIETSEGLKKKFMKLADDEQLGKSPVRLVYSTKI